MLGVVTPRVAILSAVETVSPDMPSTIDAAALCKMADRGQITGGLLDGPLAFDNAVARGGRAAKGHRLRRSPARPTSWSCPTSRPATCWSSSSIFLAGADAAGIVLGARVPIILTSRADNTIARLGSAAIALILARSRLSRRPPIKS